MLTVFRERPPILLEAQKARLKPNFFIQILIFFGVLATIAAIMFPLTRLVAPYASMTVNWFLTLFLNVLILVVPVIYCRFIEKRSLYSMGFTRTKAVTGYLTGLLTGTTMFSAALLIALICGTVTYDGFVLEGRVFPLLSFLAFFMVQGMAEEVLTRGYFMVSVASRGSILLAVLANSVLFALLHVFNDGIGILPMINIVLFGVFASIYLLKTNSIWGVSAVHTSWNFVQGIVFGIRVSGASTPVSLFSYKLKDTGSLINGGAFGLEGGLAVTIILLLSAVILLSVDGRDLREKTTENSIVN